MRVEALGSNYEVGHEFVLSGFTSTTAVIEVLEQFLGPDGDRVMLALEITEEHFVKDVRFLTCLTSRIRHADKDLATETPIDTSHYFPHLLMGSNRTKLVQELFSSFFLLID